MLVRLCCEAMVGDRSYVLFSIRSDLSIGRVYIVPEAQKKIQDPSKAQSLMEAYIVLYPRSNV